MHRKALLILAIILLFSPLIRAQVPDPGNPDTVRVITTQVDPLPSSPVVFNVPVTLYNDEMVAGGSLGLYYNSDDITIDSISLVGGGAEGMADQSLINPSIKLAAIGMVWFPGLQQIIPGDSLLANLWFTLAAGAPDQTITIDSGYFPPAGEFILTLDDGNSIVPQFKGGEIIVGLGTPPEPIIGLNPTSFTFSGVVGGATPQSQVLNITNVGDGVLSWTATWSSSWLTVFPASGGAPSNPGVSVNIAGLTAGTYNDTIVISDPNAPNSPQEVPVTLTLINPPPVIELVPDNFYFISMQDGANPANQQMTINDIGGGTLAWTAANSSSWLTLSAYSGGPGETIDLMVDITGMLYGNYYDTIVVTDPEASNSPQRAEVHLELVSSFPVLNVSPTSFNVPASASSDPPDRILKIINGGGGSLDYSITSSQGWMEFTPQTGSTPDTQEVAVTFHSVGLMEGYNRDTIVVTSSNGTESPKRIPVILWVFNNNPPALGVSTNSLSFSGFECRNVPEIPAQIMQVTNGGLDDMNWTATWSSSWLDVSPAYGVNAAPVAISVDESGLAPGTYTDTIWFDAVWSLTPAQMVEVTFQVNTPTFAPELNVNPTDLEFIFLAGFVGVSINESFYVKNDVGGCMDWYIDDPYPWLAFLPGSGNDSTRVRTYVNGGGLPLGVTNGEFVVRAPGAVGDSTVVTFKVYIAQIGDANCDAHINTSDAVFIINWIFVGGPAPIPRIWAGDVNCDFVCNISDAVYIINYIFVNGPKPCPALPPGLENVQEMTPELQQIFDQ